MDKAWLSRITVGLTTALTGALAGGLIPPKYVAWGAIVLAFLQSVQPRVQQSSLAVKVADHAVAVVAAQKAAVEGKPIPPVPPAPVLPVTPVDTTKP